MNVFEDLIVELKKENLLERSADDKIDLEDTRHLDETEVPNYNHVQQPADEVIKFDAGKVEIDSYDEHIHETAEPVAAVEMPLPRKPRNGQEFYRKRAVTEVANLQMVDHVLTGVERQFMKVVPNVYDDFNAKKALNAFLHITENENSTEHQEAEFLLMGETESWCAALAERDRNVSVASLRQYCETSRPPLSSQALVALARFYRNLPYSETVRAKFDFVITRLFSRPSENERRVCLFNREETLGHINTLYREWSSLALYGIDEDETNAVLTALSFEDLAIEVENAGTFDQMIEKDFFGRLRIFKESISEMFYAPNVLVAAIDANVRIGNAYVTLIDRERRKMDAESIQSKYGSKYDDSVSDGAARTLELVDLLRSPLNNVSVVESITTEPLIEDTHPIETFADPVPVNEARPRPPFVASFLENARSVNKTFLGASVLLIAASFGLYFYTNYIGTDQVSTSTARVVEVNDPLYAEYVTSGRVSGETFYGLLLPTWDGLSKEKRQEIVIKIYQAGKEKGYSKVTLLGRDGRSAAYASETRLDIGN